MVIRQGVFDFKMSIAEELLDAHNERLNDHPQAFVWNGVIYPACISRISKGTTPIDGGLWQEFEGRGSVEKALLPRIPLNGESMTIGDKKYYFGNVSENPNLPIVTFTISSTQAPR